MDDLDDGWDDSEEEEEPESDNKSSNIREHQASSNESPSSSKSPNSSIKTPKKKSINNHDTILDGDINELLTNYYGGSKGDINDKSTSSISNSELRTDFRSRHFDANKFAEQKVSELQVNKLVKYTEQLNHDIKALDSEMQMMVYDNYSKFIAATDTIRKMKDQVESMENEMDKLLKNMNKIGDDCQKLEVKFEPNRKEIEKLVRYIMCI